MTHLGWACEIIQWWPVSGTYRDDPIERRGGKAKWGTCFPLYPKQEAMWAGYRLHDGSCIGAPLQVLADLIQPTARLIMWDRAGCLHGVWWPVWCPHSIQQVKDAPCIPSTTPLPNKINPTLVQTTNFLHPTLHPNLH